MEVSQGDIFWISPNEANRIESDYTHPYVIVQDWMSDNVIVCALTSNLKRAKEPGNVLLDEGEANLPQQSVVEVSKIFTINKVQLGEYIGKMTEEKIHQVLAGISFVQTMTRHHK